MHLVKQVVGASEVGVPASTTMLSDVAQLDAALLTKMGGPAHGVVFAQAEAAAALWHPLVPGFALELAQGKRVDRY